LLFSENVVVTAGFARAKTKFQICTGHLEEQAPLVSRSRQDMGTVAHFVQ